VWRSRFHALDGVATTVCLLIRLYRLMPRVSLARGQVEYVMVTFELPLLAGVLWTVPRAWANLPMPRHARAALPLSRAVATLWSVAFELEHAQP
jgi:hypothetical protein